MWLMNDSIVDIKIKTQKKETTGKKSKKQEKFKSEPIEVFSDIAKIFNRTAKE